MNNTFSTSECQVLMVFSYYFIFVSFSFDVWFYQYSYVRVIFIQTLSFICKPHASDSLISFHTQLLTWHFYHHSKVQSFLVAYSIDQSIYCNWWIERCRCTHRHDPQNCSITTSIVITSTAHHFRSLVLFFFFFFFIFTFSFMNWHSFRSLKMKTIQIS